MLGKNSLQSLTLSRLFLTALVSGAAACKKQDIIDHFGGGLRVTPLALLDSSTTGDTALRSMVLHTVNEGGGELGWKATLKQPATWLSIRPDSGLAGRDSIIVAANPTGLAVGIYRDTIVVIPSNGSGAGQVPIEFRIRS